MTVFFETLEKRNKFIIYCYYFADKNMREIAQFLGVTESRVSQKITRVISEKPEMHKVLQSLKDLPIDDNSANDARDILRESILADIALELNNEQSEALASFLARGKEKTRGQDLLQVLQSVSSAYNKLSI